MRDFVPDARSAACVIPCTGLTRTSTSFTRLRTGLTNSSLIDSSYRIDEYMFSFRASSYRMDEVPPASFLVPNGRRQALFLCDFGLNERSPACLILHTGRTRSSPPFTRLRTGRTKSRLIDSAYRMDEDKFSFYMASYQTDEVQPSFFMPSERRETLKVILKRKHYREHAMGPREPTSKPIARVQTQYIRKQAQAKPNRPPKTK